jgi:hypothetical protein
MVMSIRDKSSEITRLEDLKPAMWLENISPALSSPYQMRIASMEAVMPGPVPRMFRPMKLYPIIDSGGNPLLLKELFLDKTPSTYKEEEFEEYTTAM